MNSSAPGRQTAVATEIQSSNPRKFLRIIPRVISCTIVLVLTLELCARLDDTINYGAPLFGSIYNHDSLYTYDQLGKKGKPNARFRKWGLNSLGYRGPEPAPGTTRIICLGASETFGLYEPEGSEYPRLLEQQLNERAGGQKYSVVNVALAGMPVGAMVPRIPEIAEKLKPSVALIYAGPNSYIWLPWLKVPTQAPRERWEWRIKESFRNILKQVLPESVQTYLRKREIEKEAPQYGPVMQRVPEANVERYKQDMTALVKALRAEGIEPVLVTHATLFGRELTEAEKTQLIAWRRFSPMISEEGLLDMERRGNQALRDLGKELNVAVIDAAREVPSGSKNFADFVHFTGEGSATMARVLADGLKPVLRPQGSAAVASAR